MPTSGIKSRRKCRKLLKKGPGLAQASAGDADHGTDLELEGVAVRSAAKVAIPDGSVVHIPLSEGSGRGEALVVGQQGTPAFWGAVGWHGNQHHLTWTERAVCQIMTFISKPDIAEFKTFFLQPNMKLKSRWRRVPYLG